jgi:chloramphenicol 3-O-phosphotransferase
VARVVLITGLQAAGKTTVGRLLAGRLRAPSIAFDGDVLYDMVVAGRAEMTPSPDPEAVRQLAVRYAASALLARHYADHGFSVVVSDIVLGDDVASWMAAVGGARSHLVVLAPPVSTIVEREEARGSHSYRGWQQPGQSLTEAVETMRAALDRTPARGLWLDTSGESPEGTVERILSGDLRSSAYAP